MVSYFFIIYMKVDIDNCSTYIVLSNKTDFIKGVILTAGIKYFVIGISDHQVYKNMSLGRL